MRWLVDTDRPFTSTPFGTYRFRAVAITTVAVVFAHHPADWLGSLVFGATMAWVAIKTESLWACVLMHAVARLVFHGLIDNIQTSWVKMGEQGVWILSIRPLNTSLATACISIDSRKVGPRRALPFR